MNSHWNLVFVVHIVLEDEFTESFPRVIQLAANVNLMKIETLKKRLDKSRPMTTVTLRVPGDVVE